MTVAELRKLIGKPSQVFKIVVSIADYTEEEDVFGNPISEVDVNVTVYYNNGETNAFAQTYENEEIDFKKIESQAKRWAKSLSNTYRKVEYEGYENC